MMNCRRRKVFILNGLAITVVLLIVACSQAVPLSEPAAPSQSDQQSTSELSNPEPESEPEPESDSALDQVQISIQEGTPDPDIIIDVYQPDKVWAGNTLMPDNHKPGRPRVIEVNLLGEIVWEYILPQNLKKYTNPGFDAELLPNDNILFLLPGKGVYEIDRSGSVIWSYQDKKVSHDADRLPNDNTLMVFGGNDKISDSQVKEVNPEGEIVWKWYAKDGFNKSPYKEIFNQGWTHTNAVTRLSNGNTMISPRNFNFIVEVDPQGAVVRTIGEGLLFSQHDPEILPGGNLLVVSQGRPHRAVEIDLKTGDIIWQFIIRDRGNLPVRDANRLPNGNTLITGSKTIVEVTRAGEIVWQLSLKGKTFDVLTEQGGMESSARGFYKAERVSMLR
ncbi:aryl-sulfate sulfotransferase [Chloroflexota bacterium]